MTPPSATQDGWDGLQHGLSAGSGEDLGRLARETVTNDRHQKEARAGRLSLASSHVVGVY